MRWWARLSCILVGIVALGPPAAAQFNDYLGVPGPIELEGKGYALAWTSAPSSGYVKQEYVPSGQKPAAYDQLILLERLVGNKTVAQVVRGQVEMLRRRKATDPLVNMDMFARGEETLLDFVLSARTEKNEFVVEWNAYRYVPYQDAKGTRGVLLFGRSRRAYGDANARAFLTDLKQNRMAYITALANHPVPRPTH